MFYRGKQIASLPGIGARGRATTLKQHKPRAHQPAGVEAARARIEKLARDIGSHVHDFAAMVMGRNPNPEFGFRSCYGVLGLEKGHGRERLDSACRACPPICGSRTAGEPFPSSTVISPGSTC